MRSSSSLVLQFPSSTTNPSSNQQWLTFPRRSRPTSSPISETCSRKQNSTRKSVRSLWGHPSNPLDYKLLRYGAAFLPTAPATENPFGMGFDTAGVVVEVGSGDARGLKVSDAVYGTPDKTVGGSFSEYFAVDANNLAHKPSSLTFNEVAAVPVTGLTSYQALVKLEQLQAGHRVRILGGGSATGQFAIQIAKALGGEVITTASPRNLELVKSLGVDKVVDYTSEKWGSVLAEHSVDLIYDCGVEPESWASDAQKVLKHNGKFVTIGMGPKPVESAIGATFHQLALQPTPEDLQSLTKLIEVGQVKPVIDRSRR